MRDEDIDQGLDDLVRHLPEVLRDDWVVTPKRTFHKIFVAGLLLGAAMASWIAGKVLDVTSLTWVWPAVLSAMALATKFVPWWRDDRHIEQLRRARAQASDRADDGATRSPDARRS